MTNIFPTDFTEKTTPADNDKILLADSTDSNKIKYGKYSSFKGATWNTWPAGADGTDWVSFIRRWAYSWATAYVVNDVVSYNWSSYICILDSTGNLPTNVTYWSLFAQKGTDGAGAGDMLKSTYDPANIAEQLVWLTATQTLTNKTITAPTISTIINWWTVTLPSGTHTLVSRTSTDTLTNKTLTAPVISTISNTGTLTLPTSTDTLLGRATTDTLTNKRITNRITTITSSATPTVNTDDCDCVTITELATDITSMTTNLSWTPTNFQKLIYRIKDDGTARAITWGAAFVAMWVDLPTTTVISKVLTVWFIYDTVTSKRGCVASA